MTAFVMLSTHASPLVRDAGAVPRDADAMVSHRAARQTLKQTPLLFMVKEPSDLRLNTSKYITRK
jgi:hypothetical protein